LELRVVNIVLTGGSHALPSALALASSSASAFASTSTFVTPAFASRRALALLALVAIFGHYTASTLPLEMTTEVQRLREW
jgi:hypothetical protein